MDKKRYLYEDVYDSLKDSIESNLLIEGSLIDNEFTLAEKFNVSRHTIRKALDLLEDEGFINRVSGHGTFVRKRPKTEYLLTTMRSYSEMISESKKYPESIILEAKEIEASGSVAKELETNNKTCYYIERLRLANNDIMCLEITYISKELCPNIIDYVDKKTSLFDLYENKYKLFIDSGLFHLRAMNASHNISKKLKINEGDAVLNMKANIKLKNDKILYYVDAHYIGDKYNFTTVLKRD